MGTRRRLRALAAALAATLACAAGETRVVQVAAGADDGLEAAANAGVVTDQEELPIGEGLVGIRFERPRVPPRASVRSARVSFVAARDGAGRAPGMDLWGALQSGPLAEEGLAARNRTEAEVAWPDLGKWAENGAYTSPDLSEIVQELVNQDDYSPEGAMVLVVEGFGGVIAARAFEAGAATAPTLRITFDSGVETQDTESPTASPSAAPTASPNAAPVAPSSTTPSASPSASPTGTPVESAPAPPGGGPSTDSPSLPSERPTPSPTKPSSVASSPTGPGAEDKPPPEAPGVSEDMTVPLVGGSVGGLAVLVLAAVGAKRIRSGAGQPSNVGGFLGGDEDDFRISDVKQIVKLTPGDMPGGTRREEIARLDAEEVV